MSSVCAIASHRIASLEQSNRSFILFTVAWARAAPMWSGRFAESSAAPIAVGDAQLAPFQALLEYLYTAHAPIANVDAGMFAALAFGFCPVPPFIRAAAAP